jgi:hypothetical protein
MMDNTTWQMNASVYYECLRSIHLAGLGYRLANGQLDQDDANAVIHECLAIAGWWPLAILDLGSVTEVAGFRWQNSADEIAPLALQACQRVSNKWFGDADAVTCAAEDWALDLIEEYAVDAGLELIEGERDEVQT